MEVETWAYIRRLSFVEGVSKKEIARKLSMDVKTVRKAISKESFSKTRRKSSSFKLDPFKGYIGELLSSYPRISGVRVFEEILKTGYSGGISILRDYLKGLRESRREAFLRVTTLPGEEAQVDWGECGSISVGKTKRRLSVFVMVLSFSRMLYLEFTLSQSIEAFLRCHVRAFRFFGGVPKRALYDNLKSVVLSRRGKEIRFNPKFIDFSGYYLFEPRACNVGSPHEKGKVESGIGYVKKNFLMGREFEDFTEIQSESIGWRDEVANKRVHGTTRKRPTDLFEEERDRLGRLPIHDYDTSSTLSVRASSDCFIRFDTNSYSVPYRYASMVLTIKATNQEVKVYHKDHLIATHRRSYDRYITIEDHNHTKGLLERKQEGKRQKMRDEFQDLSPEAKKYLSGLVRSERNVAHHLSKILGLLKVYGKTEVLQALDHALRFNAFGYEYIHHIILNQRRMRGLKEICGKVQSKTRPELMDTTIEERDLRLYDQLFEGKDGGEDGDKG